MISKFNSKSYRSAFRLDLYTIPACLKLEYVIAIPIPKIPSEKNPGTILNTVAPHELELYKAPLVTASVLTSVAIGPIKDTPIRIDTNPPIKFAIILFLNSPPMS